MLFNSIEFLAFLPTVFIGFWVLSGRVRLQNLLLLVASYVFYGWWDYRFLSLIVLSTCVDYVAGIRIHTSREQSRRKAWLSVSLCLNLGLLATFKYFNFFVDSWVDAWNAVGFNMSPWTASIILPVGISFYTFQTMSYSLDIYRDELKPTRDFIAFATFVSFFPQLVAGPIERASHLLPQIESHRTWKHDRFKEGVLQICVGFVRKSVIADAIGPYVDMVYNSPEIHDSTTLFLGVLLYSFQIYFDFSGYSDIAIGSAKLFGFEFNQNFNLPYFASSISEFWRRWHISLSTWLRDYLYVPLGGNRHGTLMTYRNLMATMILGGLWHGSSWNFVIWGTIHGLMLSVERALMTPSRNYRVLRNAVVFLVVSFVWVFFRAQSLSDSIAVFRGLASFDVNVPSIPDINAFACMMIGLGIGLSLDLYLFVRKIELEKLGSHLPEYLFVPTVSGLVLLISVFFNDANNFIYFQF